MGGVVGADSRPHRLGAVLLLQPARAAHPTFSSLLDIVDASRVGKTVVFALWLVLGWFLVVS